MGLRPHGDEVLSQETHVALSRKASLGGRGDYTQADSQWENNRYKVTMAAYSSVAVGGVAHTALQPPLSASSALSPPRKERKSHLSQAATPSILSSLPWPHLFTGCECSGRFSYLASHTAGTFPV